MKATMRISLHAGAHCTDEDRLLKALLRNADLLRQSGIAVPGPGKYRTLLSDTLNQLGEAAPSADSRDVMLDAILTDDPDTVARLVLSHENLFCVPKLSLAGGLLYRKAEERLIGMHRLFRGDRIELFIGLRNPATLLPAVFGNSPQDSFGDFLGGADPRAIRWSQLIARLHAVLPGLPITVWCNEDTPLIWGEVIRAVGGLPSGTKIQGAFDLLSEIMEPEGMRRFRAYLAEHPTITELQKRKVMMAFLDKYAMDEEIEEVLDLPGWDDAYVEDLTASYEADVDLIARMPNVTLIAP